MKNLLLLLFALSLHSCGLIDEVDKCETLDRVESSTSGIGVTVYDKDHFRISGITVKIETWKVHCNGSIGKPPGDVITGVTGYKGSAPGYFAPAYNYGYSYKTLYDKVHFKVTLSKNGAFIDEDDFVYSYNSLPPRYIDAKFYIDKKWK